MKRQPSIWLSLLLMVISSAAYAIDTTTTPVDDAAADTTEVPSETNEPVSSTPSTGGDAGLTWRIPNTNDGGAVNNPGASWFNADTSISYRVPFAAAAEHDDGNDLFDPAAFAVGAPDSPTARTPSNISNFQRPTAPMLARIAPTKVGDVITGFDQRAIIAEPKVAYPSLKAIDTSVVARPITTIADSHQRMTMKDEFAESTRVAGDPVLKDMKPPTEIIKIFNH